jgi:hypothetical protein
MKAFLKSFAALLLVTVVFSFSAAAQHVNLGIKGGLNLYNINNEDGPKYDTKAGFHAGLLAHIHFDRSIAVQPELIYSSQGAKYTIGGTEFKLNLDYINVPVLLQFMFDNGFRLEAGPQAGFLVKASSQSNNIKVDVKDNFKPIDFAVVLGIGYIKPNTGFGFDLRYNTGLSNINENSSVKSTNNGFQLGVFYQFNHK